MYEVIYHEVGKERKTKNFQSLYAAAEFISNLHWWNIKVSSITIIRHEE